MRKVAAFLLLVFVQTYAGPADDLRELEEMAEQELGSGELESKGEVDKRIIMPGTLWCGMGNNAENDNELGEYGDVDSCCRTHDKCDRTVKAFAKKYEYRNWRPFTVSDCECDSKFHKCLKDVKEHKKASEIVGKLFFNILEMPCLRFNTFGLKAERGSSPKF